jgi:transcriptional regulator with XRE-family HTH domain
METALDKINKLAGSKVSSWKDDAIERSHNREWTQLSFRIALRILQELRRQKPVNGMSQKKLADEMGVSPQYINKLVKGKENLSLETIAKIESVLGISLLEIPSGQASSVAPEGSRRSGSSVVLNECIIHYNTGIYLEATGTNG